jgi:hypothetical protein
LFSACWCWFFWGIGRSQFRFIEAQGGRDEAAIGERSPDGRQEVGSEPPLKDIAEPARIECRLGEVGVFVDREEDQARRPVRATQLARRFDAVEPRHGDVEHDDIRMELLRLSEEFASILSQRVAVDTLDGKPFRAGLAVGRSIFGRDRLVPREDE